MSKYKKMLIYWLPPLIWMFIIFYLSSRPRFGITEKYLVDFIIFKSFHMLEYGFLYFLMFRALYKTNQRSTSRHFAYALILTILYAVSDEIHQHFVPTREGRLRDVIIDTAGITIMYLYLKYNLDFVHKYF